MSSNGDMNYDSMPLKRSCKEERKNVLEFISQDRDKRDRERNGNVSVFLRKQEFQSVVNTAEAKMAKGKGKQTSLWPTELKKKANHLHVLLEELTE